MDIGISDTASPAAEVEYVQSAYVAPLRDGEARSEVSGLFDGRITIRSNADKHVVTAWKKAGNSHVEDITRFANQEYAQTERAADSGE